MSMECKSAKQRLSAYVDGAVPAEELHLLNSHLNICGECALESERYGELRRKLRSLPQPVPPADLTTRLRVAASKVRMESLRSPWQRWRDRLDLTLRNLMRPVALPAVGGLCSAVFLFSTFVPMFKSAFALSVDPGDVPTMLVTQPMLKYMAPVAFANSSDAVVDLQIDDQGQIVNFTIVSAPGQDSETLSRNIKNNLCFIELWPATTFGHGVAGTVRISFSSSRIDVRG